MFATVTLDDRVAKPLDYAIPDTLKELVQPGARVIVPLRGTLCKATVLHIRDKTHLPLNQVQPIQEMLLEGELLPKDLMQLADWMSKYYATNLQKVFKFLLPSPLRKGTQEKTQLFIKKQLSYEETISLCRNLREHHSAQAKVLDVLLTRPKGILLTELMQIAQVSKSPIDSLIKRKAISASPIHIDRSAVEDFEFFQTKPKALSEEQNNALQNILHSLENKEFSTKLLYGITGSGKTEVYFQAMRKALDLGLSVIYLVPEIALTSQTIERLKARFEEKILVLHHRLSDGERYDSWQAIRKGKVSIVLGARSAIFAPLPNLGLILVDEEHDGSFKQSDEMPCYHARDVAIVRAKLNSCPIVMGSATPSMESYYNALKGKYELLTLSNRPTSHQRASITLVDTSLDKERSPFGPLFSNTLLQKIEKRLKIGEQSILFLNRRGTYAFLSCSKCSYSIKCVHCDVSMTYHKPQHILICHLCGFSKAPEKDCPSCLEKESMNFHCPGTEQVERTLHVIFPQAKTLRMDLDTTRHKGSHEKLYKQFRSGKADILIGTQMIAKGLHFPCVTLVGVLNADSALNVPDFRASEQVFQLLVQVSGRAGRSELEGEVVIQTKLKDHLSIRHCQNHDYLSFYNEEYETRKIFSYPPHVKMVKVTISGEDQVVLEEQAKLLLQKIIPLMDPSTTIFPFVPCGHYKIKDIYRLQLLLKGPKCHLTASKLAQLLEKENTGKKIKFLIDVDPLRTFS